MKIKKCCKDSDKIHVYDMNTLEEQDEGKEPNIQPTIWYIPDGCYEEEGESVIIKYCPFCGKKIEVIE